MVESLWIALALLLVVATASLLVALRCRREAAQYRAKILDLKSEIGVLREARQSAERYDALISRLREAVLRIDSEGRVLAANDRACKLFSIRRDQLPRSLNHFYRESEWCATLKARLRQWVEGSAAVDDPPEIKIDGYVLAPRISRLESRQFLLLCLDVTAQHRLEKQRRVFLSNIMHDLKTPLTSLLGYARSLQDFGEDAAFRREAVAVIADEAKHVNRLLDALLQLDQVEYRRADAQAVCDPVQVLEKTVSMLKPQCQDGRVTIEIRGETGASGVLMDAIDFDRVMTNILSNALRYSPADGVVTVTLAWQDGQCLIRVDDQGEGIPEHYLERVTERFFRVDQSRSRGVEGHGLGLAIVKALVESAKGRLQLMNRQPQGLRVEIHLPAAKR